LTAAHEPRPTGASADDHDTGPLLVPAQTSLQEQRPRTLKHGDTFAVYDQNGDVLSAPGSPEGLFHADTRHLSHLRLSIDGARPMLLRSGLRDDNAALICDLSNPDMHDANGRIALHHDTIHIRRVRLLWDGAAYERISVKNYDQERRTLRLSVTFDADFADIFEVRGATRARRGQVHPRKSARTPSSSPTPDSTTNCAIRICVSIRRHSTSVRGAPNTRSISRLAKHVSCLLKSRARACPPSPPAAAPSSARSSMHAAASAPVRSALRGSPPRTRS